MDEEMLREVLGKRLDVEGKEVDPLKRKENRPEDDLFAIEN